MYPPHMTCTSTGLGFLSCTRFSTLPTLATLSPIAPILPVLFCIVLLQQHRTVCHPKSMRSEKFLGRSHGHRCSRCCRSWTLAVANGGGGVVSRCPALLLRCTRQLVEFACCVKRACMYPNLLMRTGGSRGFPLWLGAFGGGIDIYSVAPRRLDFCTLPRSDVDVNWPARPSWHEPKQQQRCRQALRSEISSVT